MATTSTCPGRDVGHQASERGPVDVLAAEAGVVVANGQRHPAFAALAGDVRFDRFALRLNAAEVHLARDGLSAVDRDARRRDRGGGGPRLLHARFLAVRLKNNLPFQCEPVTANAIALSEPNRRPSTRTRRR